MSKQDHIGDKFPRKFGKYHLLGPLAQGGMGALYLAAAGDRGLERLLVIKTVLPHLADSEYVARFRDEAKVVVKLSHGNLVPVFDAGQVGGELFLAMDFVEGKDLRAIWNRCAKKQVAFPVDVAVYLIKELCRGLHYAHHFRDLELVHRDVSPPNLLISYSGEVKLTDFGLASSTLKLEKTAPGIIYGKVAYMSPEQARGEPLDGRSDLYAAGIILWELLTGRQLFPPGEEQPQDLLQRARDPQVMSPSKRAPRVPASLDAIVLKALAPEREDRYATGNELRAALSGWLAAEAPGTDAARIEAFLAELFAEDMATERGEREELLARTRERAYTLSPSDELRQMVEGGDDEDEHGGVRREDIPGRRAADRGAPPRDRRRQSDRRALSQGDLDDDWGLEEGSGDAERTEQRAVSVPRPRQDGRTVATPVPGGAAGAAAVAEREEFAPEPDPDPVGQVLDGRYLIGEMIGEGGMGRVYLAEHVEIGKRVAVKILHPVYGHMPDLVERFRREARAASRIGHPHIVDVTDSGTTKDGSAYFVMEYLEGVELASVIDREGAMEVARALRIATQICRALSAAHASGIIHRDLKPENVYLTIRDGTSDFVKVLDFGIAKSTEAEEARAKRLTSPGVAMGTPEYMSPEQAAGRPADARCDVYSVGAILYEMLTGVPPYEGDNFMEILTKKATIDPAAPRILRPELPPRVNELVIRAMARNPDDRPGTMEAFEYELTKCLAGRGVAVAQILGMTTDPNLVASLNPGITLRPDDSGLGAEPPHEPAEARAVRRKGSDSGAVAAKGSPPAGSPATVAALPSSLAGALDPEETGEFGESTVNVPPLALRPRSSLGLFGWLLLGALLITAVGVIFFVAAGERSGRSQARAAAAGAGHAGAAVVGGQAAAANDADDPDAEDRDGDGDEPASVEAEPGAAQRGATRPATRTPRAPQQRPDPAASPRTREEAVDLLREAESHVANMEWARARAGYERLVAGKHLRAQALLGLARVAFETEDTDGAIRYARRALSAGAGDPARMFLGHAYFKQQRYADALRYYEDVLERDPGNKEAQRSASDARRLMQ